MPDPVLDTRNISVNKREKDLCPQEDEGGR